MGLRFLWPGGVRGRPWFGVRHEGVAWLAGLAGFRAAADRPVTRTGAVAEARNSGHVLSQPYQAAAWRDRAGPAEGGDERVACLAGAGEPGDVGAECR
jgi:hypothetical protein